MRKRSVLRGRHVQSPRELGPEQGNPTCGQRSFRGNKPGGPTQQGDLSTIGQSAADYAKTSPSAASIWSFIGIASVLISCAYEPAYVA